MLRARGSRLALAACLAAGAAAVPAEAIVSFQTTELEDALFSGANNPQAVTIADVDGDNLGDVIAVEPDDDLMTVFINEGEGEFGLGDSYDTAGSGPVAVATGLFNADVFIDIVTVDTIEGTISVFLNDEDGAAIFDDLDPRQFQVAANPIGVAVGDFNGDTRADLAVLSPDVIYLLQGNGDGTFSAFNPVSISTRSTDSFAIASADLNDDRTLDLVTTNRGAGSGQAAVFFGTGNGSFTFNGFINVGRAPAGLAIADANGDLTNDLMVVDTEADLLDEVTLLTNDGDGSFQAPRAVTGPEEPWAITTLDVEPDGKVDLAVTSLLDDEMFLLCQLSDKCTQPPFGGSIEAGIWRSAIGGTIPGCRRGGQVAIASGKLNGDAMDDLVALRGDLTTLCVMLNTSIVNPTATPTATPTPTQTGTPASTATPTLIHIGDSGCSIVEGSADRGIGFMLAGILVFVGFRRRAV